NVTSTDVAYFFFSSRRRHTRSKRDWSSNVCSSDLPVSSVVFLSSTAIGTSTVVVIVDNLFPVNVIDCVVGYDSGVAFTVLTLVSSAQLSTEKRGDSETSDNQ